MPDAPSPPAPDAPSPPVPGGPPQAAPGVVHRPPAKFVPRFHWELLVCGVSGHRLLGLDARAVRPEDALVVRERDGVRWHRCLRCDSWLPLPPPDAPARAHPEDRADVELPLRGRPLRDRVVLRLIAIDRALHFLLLGLVATAILVFSANRADLHHTVFKVMTDLGVTTRGAAASGHGLTHELDRLFSLKSGTLHLFAAVAAVYALVEGIEAVGLWYGKRWAEYLTFLVTASLLPVEVYELAHNFSPFKIVTFLINVAVVVYLLFAKRLFGIRGGAAADHALRERDMGWGALEAAGPPASA